MISTCWLTVVMHMPYYLCTPVKSLRPKSGWILWIIIYSKLSMSTTHSQTRLSVAWSHSQHTGCLHSSLLDVIIERPKRSSDTSQTACLINYTSNTTRHQTNVSLGRLSERPPGRPLETSGWTTYDRTTSASPANRWRRAIGRDDSSVTLLCQLTTR